MCLNSFQYYYKVNKENIQCSWQKSALLFSQNNCNFFDFLNMWYAENYKKLKKESELYIRENSKKFLGGNAHGRIDKGI